MTACAPLCIFRCKCVKTGMSYAVGCKNLVAQLCECTKTPVVPWNDDECLVGCRNSVTAPFSNPIPGSKLPSSLQRRTPNCSSAFLPTRGSSIGHIASGSSLRKPASPKYCNPNTDKDVWLEVGCFKDPNTSNLAHFQKGVDGRCVRNLVWDSNQQLFVPKRPLLKATRSHRACHGTA